MRNPRVAGGLLGVSLLVNVMLGFIYFREPRVATPTQSTFENPFPFIDPARSFIEQKHFISTIQPIRDAAKDIVNRHSQSADIVVYIEYLNTGANISINQDIPIYPASLAKLPLAIAVMKKIERGIWNGDSTFEITAQDRDNRSGTLYRLPVGQHLSIQELLEALLIHSDNTAYNIFLRHLTFTELTEIVESTGLDQLFREDGQVTAKEYSRLFRILYTASFLNRKYSQEILELLARSPFSELINARVPSHIPFAHKWGHSMAQRVSLDSGILYIPHRPLLVTVMIRVHNNLSEEESVALAKSVMSEIGEVSFKSIAEYE